MFEIFYKFVLQETIRNFEVVHNIQIPESTVRGLRRKYLNTLSMQKVKSISKPEQINKNPDSTNSIRKKYNNATGCPDLTELHYGKRGRPMRLGKVAVIAFVFYY